MPIAERAGLKSRCTNRNIEVDRIETVEGSPSQCASL
eukprot:CAMPEP_0185591656 /NCGR_PEP_ID=MMETSP0434-20130131/65251_1 /TAXON_ID=626734 ORGANISM="Favella taraikaensis, Strain Fe Narragansett Bay" /NCGR_SAMPLE_ID=MMETSP0434 /ASSEMBLY_ACC=CAM_ASM_000379 /LENGTH=36 /DNA_ID= /DNA_START= /DNA_END= /DNA_ORIENTATION=